MPHPPFTSSNEERYSRQILFPGIGVAGQALLAEARVAIVGVGATGAATASLLARAGVGHLTLIDRDIVEPSNLQRQLLFDEADAAAAVPKAEAARAKIALFNSGITVEARIADLVPGNIHELLGPAALLLDCTDNFETRYLLNDYSVQQGKPWIYAAAIGAYAATMNIIPPGIDNGFPLNGCAAVNNSLYPERDSRHPEQNSRHPEQSEAPLSFSGAGTPLSHTTGCLACLFPSPPSGSVETCDTAGILGSAVNFAASVQSAEALKLLTGQAHLLRRTLLSYDLWSNQRSEISNSRPDPDCLVCQRRQFLHLAGTARPHITLCGRNSVQIHEHHRPLRLPELHARLTPNPTVHGLQSSPLLLRFRHGAHQVTVFPDGRALIQGTTDPAIARSLYARFVGA